MTTHTVLTLQYSIICSGASLIQHLPFLEGLPGWMGGGRDLWTLVRSMEDVFLKPHIKHHLDTFSDDKAEDDLMYAYISRMNKKKDLGKETYLDGNEFLSSFL